MIRAASFLLLLILFAVPASAHQTGQATFVVHVKPDTRQIDMLVTCPVLDVSHAAGLQTPQEAWNSLGSYLDKHIEVSNDGEVCQPIEHKVSPARTRTPSGSSRRWSAKSRSASSSSPTTR